jgi:hypothetical protein
MAPNGTPAVAVPEILDDVAQTELPVEPEEPEAAQPAVAAPEMSAREKRVATLKELCEAKGKKFPPVTQMSDEALAGYIKTLSALPAK